MKRLFPLLFITLIGCEKETPNPEPSEPVNNYFILGTATYNFPGVDTGWYDTAQDITTAYSIRPGARMTIKFPGVGAGVRSWTYPDTTHDNNISALIIIDDTVLYRYTEVTIDVTEYGAVGGQIKVSFTGQFINLFNPTADTLSGSGQFSVVRQPDT